MPSALQLEQIVRDVAGWRLVLQPTRETVFRWKVYGFQGETTVLARGFDKADAVKNFAAKAGINKQEALAAFESGEHER